MDLTQIRFQSLFEKQGEVTEVKINFDRSGRSEGTGSVLFRHLADAQNAVRAYNGQKLNGLELDLKIGVEEPKRRNTSVDDSFDDIDEDEIEQVIQRKVTIVGFVI